MQFIKPVSISDATLISSTIAEIDYSAWASGTTYALGDKVILTSTHRVYESLQAANTNRNPTEAASTWWLDIGPTNRWAMFDDVVSTQTTANASMTVSIAPGMANGLAIINMSGVNSIDVTMTVDATVVYSRSIDLISAVSDWYGYFFDSIIDRTDYVITDLPLYASGVIEVVFSGASTMAIGVLAAGVVSDLGLAKYGAKIGITDYSKKDTDDFGNTIIVRRAFSKRFTVDLELSSADVDAIASKLSDARSIPCVWIGANNLYQSLIVYGFYRDFSVDIAYPAISYCSLDIEGLI